MNKEIGYIILRGWHGWRGNANGIIRSFYLLPYIRVSLPWGVGRCLLCSEFGFAFWSGEFSVFTTTKEEKKKWREGRYAI
jgi:hypothetical protein